MNYLRLNEPLADGAVIHIVPRLAGPKVAVGFQVVGGGAIADGMVESLAAWGAAAGVSACSLGPV